MTAIAHPAQNPGDEHHTEDLEDLEGLARIRRLVERALTDHDITLDDVLPVAALPLETLVDAAADVTHAHASKTFNLCAIVNAKSGKCSENCRWCSQSASWSCGSPEYPLIDAEAAIKSARAAYEGGATRFSLVMSGRKLSAREVRETAALVRRLREAFPMEVCISAGLLTENEFLTLKAAGAARCHCNLEAAPSFFPEVCTSHTFDAKVKTLEAARRAGLQICSGGIIGMGEDRAARIELALALRRLRVPSIPLNILEPIPGTPLGTMPRLAEDEIVRTAALWRLLNPKAELRFAGGRRRLSDACLRACFRAGVNAAIAGDMLTTPGADREHELKLVREAGYALEADDGLAVDRAHIWHPYAGTLIPPRVEKVVGAEGVRLKLADGRELIDGTSAWWCALFGYKPRPLVEALQRQVAELPHVMFGGLTHDPAIGLARRLVDILPKPLQRIFFADSGSVAVEAAMKLAVQYQMASNRPARTGFVTIEGGYHGDTWNAMSVCDPTAGMHGAFGGALPQRHFVPAPQSRFGGDWDPADIEPLRAFFETHDDVAAFILEPILQGASAMRFYHPQYLAEAAKLCREHDVLLILDEIATGFGRTGKTFASEWAGVTPDVMTIGKGLTGGMVTLAAVAVTNRVADRVSSHPPYAFMHGPTFMANPIACATASAALDLYASDDWPARARALGERLEKGLAHLRGRPGIRDVRVLGAVAVVETEVPGSTPVLQPRFVEAGVWVRPIGRLWYLMPPFVMTDEETDALLKGFLTVLERHLTENPVGAVGNAENHLETP